MTGWWFQKESGYPTLYKVACIYLAVPTIYLAVPTTFGFFGEDTVAVAQTSDS